MADPIEELRVLASVAAPPAPGMQRYLEKVRSCAYSISDDDVGALKQAGVAEDEIFEATVAVAVGEGLRRLDAALRVLE